MSLPTSHKCRLTFDGVARDKHGKVTGRVHVESDLLLRNWLCLIKVSAFDTSTVAADGVKDVLAGTGVVSARVGAIPYNMLGSGATPETSVDYKIQAPLYVPPDTCTLGTVTLGIGNQVVLALTSAHTFAAGATVTEAGFLWALGSAVTYLTAGNYQLSHNVFAAQVIGIGGTFTSTYTITDN